MVCNIQLSTTIHRASHSPRKHVTSQAIPLVRVFAPVLPAWLKQVRRSQEGVITENGSDSIEVWGAISSDKLVNFGGEVRKLLDGRTQFIGSQKTRGTIKLLHRKTFKQGLQRFEGIRQLGRGHNEGQEAGGGGDSEGVQGLRQGCRVIMDMRKTLHGSGRGWRDLGLCHFERDRRGQDSVYVRVILWETIWYQREERKTLTEAESRPKDEVRITKETGAA